MTSATTSDGRVRPPPPPHPPSRPRLTRSQRENRVGMAMSAPSMLVVVLVIIVPFLAVIVFAFADIRLVDIPRLSPATIDWSLDNLTDALTSSGFWDALGTTLTYAALTTVGAVGAGVMVALAMRRPFRGRGLVRAALLIPYVLPVVAAATVWRTMLNPQYGVVNAVGVRWLGWDNPVAFLNTRQLDVAGVPIPLTLLVVIAFEIWKTAPLAFLFVTARLQSVPAELEEAAALDGASTRQTLQWIIGPQLRAVVLLLVLLRFIWSFQSFNDIYLLTQGAGGTQVMAVRVYEELITRADIGSAAAYGLLMSAILAVLLTAYVLLLRRRESM